MERIKTAILSAVAVDHPVKQGITTIVLSAVAVQARMLVIPLLALVALMVADFITGLRAAKYRGEEISSSKYFSGIEKKVYLLLLVGVGLIIDLIVLYAVHAFDLAFTMPVAIAVVVCLWLVVNEVISILENVQDIGVDMPKWLLPFVKNIKKKVEAASPNTENKD